jgi:hypothetical protein
VGQITTTRSLHPPLCSAHFEEEQKAIREMKRLRAQGMAVRPIAEAVRAKGHKISHEGVAGVLRASSTRAT